MPATQPRIFTARYDGTCPKCGTPIRMGDQLLRSPGAKATHRLCEIPAGRPIAQCACGSALADAGYCSDLAMFGEHRSAS